METAANSIRTTKRPILVLLPSQMKSSAPGVIEVNGNSEYMILCYRSNFVFAKSAIFAQVCYICPSVLYFPEVGKIQHGAMLTENMTIKAHFNLLSRPCKIQQALSF